MKKMMTAVLAIVAVMTLFGCAKSKPAKKSSSSSSTTIAARKYTPDELKERYVTITDAVMTPITEASYSQPDDKIKASIEKGQTALADVHVELDDNESTPELTAALKKFAVQAGVVLAAMTGTDQEAYKAATSAFFDQCNGIARDYFQGSLPDSLTVYSERMNANNSSSENAAPEAEPETKPEAEAKPTAEAESKAKPKAKPKKKPANK